jgi:K+-sensing histidine kinase KdpD
MRSLTCLLRRRQLAATTYQLTDCFHEGRTVHVSADEIACTVSAWSALAHEHRGGMIAVALRRHHDHVLIDVRDDGVGIDPGAMETLFNRFSHGKTHTAAGDHPRYGIGLALVREIAHAHRGHITNAQTPGGGATFTLTIPAAPVGPMP